LNLAKAVILPGVGAFGDCIHQLRQRGFWEPIAEWLKNDRPFLGICVGYQALFEGSEESPGAAGFGFFKGQVRKFQEPGLKVPQIGWNSLELSQPHALWKGLPPNPHVYFVHSYYPEPTKPSETTARCHYGVPFAAAASRGNISGVQFHPEKSQTIGLAILRNFLESVK
jgi:glutamine amidotransferase